MEGKLGLSPLGTSIVVFAIIGAGVFAGAFLRKTLPKDHLTDDAKDVVRLGTGLIGTIAALVLGLLIASANGSYDTQSGEIKRMIANIIEIDQLLAQYGPETRSARDLLRHAIEPLADRIWQEQSAALAEGRPFEATAVAGTAFAEVLALSPQNDTQRLLKARAMEVGNDLAQTRLLLFAQSGSSIPLPFLGVLVFWLAMIFLSFSLFSRLNPTVIVALFVFALSASGAIFLILELSQPFAGLMQISSAPLRNALPPI